MRRPGSLQVLSYPVFLHGRPAGAPLARRRGKAGVARPGQRAGQGVAGPRSTAQLRRDAGIGHFEYQVLALLSEAPGRTLRMSELATLAEGSLPRLSQVAARLEQRGWVRRTAASGRRPLHPGDPDRPGPGEGDRGRARPCPGGPPAGLRPADQDPVPAAARDQPSHGPRHRSPRPAAACPPCPYGHPSNRHPHGGPVRRHTGEGSSQMPLAGTVTSCSSTSSSMSFDAVTPGHGA